jgi:hypothetical protein
MGACDPDYVQKMAGDPFHPPEPDYRWGMAGNLQSPRLPHPSGSGTFWIPLSVQTLSVNPRSATLSLIPEEARLPRARWDVGGDDLESPVTGNMKRVRVVMIKRGPKELCTLLYYGRSDCVSWDPELFQWDSSTPFMSYTAKLGRGLLKQRHVVPDVIMTK